MAIQGDVKRRHVTRPWIAADLGFRARGRWPRLGRFIDPALQAEVRGNDDGVTQAA
jgi:hypothetical protein